MTLEDIRKEIDSIDAQLLPLVKARMDCAKKVAEIKMEQGLPIFNAERERQILERVAQNAGEYGGEAKIVYSTLMEASRALQHNMMGDGREIRALVENAGRKLRHTGHIACAGVKGSYSHEAAERLFPDSDPLFYHTFADVVFAIEDGSADLGLLPVENSSAGSVSEVYDLILKYRFSIVAATTLRIHHCLAVPVGADLEKVTTVYSHHQALSQCSDFIARSSYSPAPFSNTAAAAKMVAETGGNLAAICSEQAADVHGLQIVKRDIQNSDNNCTRFIAISRERCIPDDAQKISLCFSLPHTTGSLYSVLSRFAINGLNLTKIESRPIANAGKNFEYDFYLDFTGNIRQAQTLDLIASLQEELPRFSFLGNYREDE